MNNKLQKELILTDIEEINITIALSEIDNSLFPSPV